LAKFRQLLDVKCAVALPVTLRWFEDAWN